MATTSETTASLIYLISHHKRQAATVWDEYPDLLDAYFMYDFYMQQAGKWEQKLIELLS